MCVERTFVVAAAAPFRDSRLDVEEVEEVEEEDEEEGSECQRSDRLQGETRVKKSQRAPEILVSRVE